MDTDTVDIIVWAVWILIMLICLADVDIDTVDMIGWC